MSAYVTCPLKRNGFYPMYIWFRRHNLVHRKYSFDFFFCTNWLLRVLNSSPKSMNWELPFVVLNWDQALFSFRFVNNIPAGMAKRMRTAQIGHDLRLSSFVLIDFGVRLSRIHFSPTVRGGEMNAWQTNPKDVCGEANFSHVSRQQYPCTWVKLS